MSEQQPAGAPRVLRVTALVAVCAGVAALAAAAFIFSYAGIHSVALQAGVNVRLARGYPLILDVLLVVVLAAVLALRGAGWPSKLLAWISLIDAARRRGRGRRAARGARQAAGQDRRDHRGGRAVGAGPDRLRAAAGDAPTPARRRLAAGRSQGRRGRRRYPPGAAGPRHPTRLRLRQHPAAGRRGPSAAAPRQCSRCRASARPLRAASRPGSPLGPGGGKTPTSRTGDRRPGPRDGRRPAGARATRLSYGEPDRLLQPGRACPDAGQPPARPCRLSLRLDAEPRPDAELAPRRRPVPADGAAAPVRARPTQTNGASDGRADPRAQPRTPVARGRGAPSGPERRPTRRRSGRPGGYRRRGRRRTPTCRCSTGCGVRRYRPGPAAEAATGR